jgi:hypothetical protein
MRKKYYDFSMLQGKSWNNNVFASRDILYRNFVTFSLKIFHKNAKTFFLPDMAQRLAIMGQMHL